jgi:hypothetical protein
MRRALAGALLVFALLAPGATAGEESQAESAARIAKSLAEADPLAEGSAPALLAPFLAPYERGYGYGEPPFPLRAICDDSAQTEVVRDRARRLRVALTRLTWVHGQPGGERLDMRQVMWWLALDELDRELPKGPRETLLACAIADAPGREAALKALAAARDVALRFCRDWNEIEHDAAETKKYADLRAELTKAGRAAIPYLATLLAVPPQAVFTNLDEARGPTARQQVRALFALDFLDAHECMEHFVFHIRGPSFTECATARAAIKRLAKLEWPDGADEAKQVAVIDAWWAKLIPRKPEDTPDGGVRDHLVRHTLRWSRNALASGKPELAEGAEWGPRQLEHVVGKLVFDPDAPLEKRASQLKALEDEAMKTSPTYMCFR